MISHIWPVSYTHLDVYKRQALKSSNAKPAFQIVEREYGEIELHSYSPEDVKQAGEAVLEACGLTVQDLSLIHICKQAIEDSLQMLEEESDEEMRELAKEELNDSKARVEELEHELKILLLPKDPNDDKNVIVEIRAGAGGDEAALFAAEIYRMYLHYAESQRWKVELVECEEIGIGGMRCV